MSSFDVDSFVSSDCVSRQPCINNNTRERILEYLQDRLANGAVFTRDNPLVIADVGCGDGKFTKELVSEHIPSEITHITKYLIDPYGSHSIGISTLNDNDFANKFPSNHVDLIICKGVVHLMSNFINFLQQCERILKPDGMFIIVHMSDEILFPWGKWAQKSFEVSVKADSYKWIVYDELKQNQYNMTSNKLIPLCKVKHERMTKAIKVTKLQWIRFIKEQSWSTLQSLDDIQLDECVKYAKDRFIDYKDDQIIKLDMKWIVTTMRKTRKPQRSMQSML